MRGRMGPGFLKIPPPSIDPEKTERIIAALDDGASKAYVRRSFRAPRSTLLDAMARIWRAGSKATNPGTLG